MCVCVSDGVYVCMYLCVCMCVDTYSASAAKYICVDFQHTPDTHKHTVICVHVHAWRLLFSISVKGSIHGPGCHDNTTTPHAVPQNEPSCIGSALPTDSNAGRKLRQY